MLFRSRCDRRMFILTLALATVACANKKPVAHANAVTLATLIERAHDPLAQMDFLRISFVPAKYLPITTLGNPKAFRTFFGASSYFLLPLPLKQMVTYPGLSDGPTQDDQYLVAMRCRPTDGVVVDPILATWPNVLQAISEDLAVKSYSCPAQAGDAENEAFCIAQRYKDTPRGFATLVLSDTLNAAAMFYPCETKASFDSPCVVNSALDKWLQQNYGIYPAFSGLGLSVKDSASLSPTDPLSSKVILRNSITPEYLLRNRNLPLNRNVTLREAGCRCIIVHPYEDPKARADELVDPEFVWQKGLLNRADGSCAKVEKLGVAETRP